MQAFQVMQRFVRIRRRGQQELDTGENPFGNAVPNPLNIQAGARGVAEFYSFQQTLHVRGLGRSGQRGHYSDYIVWADHSRMEHAGVESTESPGG